MDTGKCQRLELPRCPDQFIGLIASGATATKLKLLVEEQIPGRLAVLNR